MADLTCVHGRAALCPWCSGINAAEDGDAFDHLETVSFHIQHLTREQRNQTVSIDPRRAMSEMYSKREPLIVRVPSVLSLVLGSLRVVPKPKKRPPLDRWRSRMIAAGMTRKSVRRWARALRSTAGGRRLLELRMSVEEFLLERLKDLRAR